MRRIPDGCSPFLTIKLRFDYHKLTVRLLSYFWGHGILKMEKADARKIRGVHFCFIYYDHKKSLRFFIFSYDFLRLFTIFYDSMLVWRLKTCYDYNRKTEYIEMIKEQ